MALAGAGSWNEAGKPMRFVLVLLLSAAILFFFSATSVQADAPEFTRGALNFSINAPTSLAFGPDGRLYVSAEDQIRALTLDGTGTQVVSTETIATGQVGILGLAFDPTAPSSPVVVYASRREPSATDSYEGRVSKFTGPTWTRQDVITGLPSSNPYTNHFTNGLAFDEDGLLFIAQGSNTDAGLQGGFYPETPLSAAILVADVTALGFNGTVTYSPAGVPVDDNVNQTGGDVAVYAAGTRNPYDLVVHSSGNIYATDNGPNGPNTSATCTTTGTGVSQSDELNKIEQGDYYGFPNRNRGRFDVRQCTYRSPLIGSGFDYTGPAALLPPHCSCNGITEFTSSLWGPEFEGDLLMAQFIFGQLARVDLNDEGTAVFSVSTLDDGFDQPLDVTVGTTGIIYVAEFNGDQISYLVPTPKSVGGIAELAAPDTGGRDGWLIGAASAATALLASGVVFRAIRRRA
jgi:glucose/arabinose dehydrogenase